MTETAKEPQIETPLRPESIPFTILPFQILADRSLRDGLVRALAGMFYFLLRKGDIKGDLNAYVALSTGKSYGQAVDLVRELKRRGYTLKSLREQFNIVLGKPVEEPKKEEAST